MNDTAQQPVDHVTQVFHWLTEGHTAGDIVEALADLQIEGDQARFVIEQALKKFVESASLPPEVRAGWCLEAFRHLYHRLVKTGDYTGAIRCVQEIAKLSGADQVSGIHPDDSDHEIDEYIDKVLKL